MKTCIYPGSFDIFTLGHKYIVDEALKIFDKVYVAIGENAGKNSAFTLEEKKEMIDNVYKDESRVEIINFENEFLVHVCDKYGITTIVRGVRNVKDFEYERQVDEINTKINPRVQTIFMFPPNELAGVSSSMVKGLIGISGWQFVVRNLVPVVNMPIISTMAFSNKYDPDDNADGVLYRFFHNETDKGAMYKEVRDELFSAYNANGRYYHTIQHVNEMLLNYEHGDITDNLTWAILFHDYVYDPTSKTNEEDSVKVWEEFADKVGGPLIVSKERVSELIMTTKNHRADDDLEAQKLIDLDFAILASDTKRFNEYERQIRAEYGMIDDEAYRKGRIDFVTATLSRNSIFLTTYYKREMEKKARTNLNKLLESLNE